MAIIDQGKLLFSGTPESAEQQIAGRVWQKSVAKAELKEIGLRHRIISTKLVAGRPLVHILSETNPGDGFVAVAPDLEDVFFSQLPMVA